MQTGLDTSYEKEQNDVLFDLWNLNKYFFEIKYITFNLDFITH